jgi:acetolactate synthase-1/3 small subunit
MVATRHVQDVTRDPNGLERELALVKVKGVGADRVEALRISEIIRARVLDTTIDSFIFEVTGASSKIDKFIELMRPLGLVEVSRTGVAAITRGPEGM